MTESEVPPHILHVLKEEIQGELVSKEMLDEAIDQFEYLDVFLGSHPGTVAKRSRLTRSQADTFLLEMRKYVGSKIKSNQHVGVAS